jgi:hypothetical protein
LAAIILAEEREKIDWENEKKMLSSDSFEV